jgi:hypothetical protein
MMYPLINLHPKMKMSVVGLSHERGTVEKKRAICAIYQIRDLKDVAQAFNHPSARRPGTAGTFHCPDVLGCRRPGGRVTQ